MLGHELRNPLSPIVIAVELMHLRGVSSKELSVIERQLKQLVRLVDDLLDVSRIARGKVDLHKERTSIAEVVKRAVETTQPLFQQRQQPLALDVPGDLFVDGDPTRLRAGVREPADERLEVQRSGHGRRRLGEARREIASRSAFATTGSASARR